MDARQPDRRRHEAAVDGLLAALLSDGAGIAQPASSSPRNSPSTSWKSLASRKLR